MPPRILKPHWTRGRSPRFLVTHDVGRENLHLLVEEVGEAVGKVVVVGGGTAGWISAALLMKVLGKVVNVTLVESDDIGTIGVGEATIPPLSLNKVLGLNEADFMHKTQATIKLGIQFENWGRPGNVYMHAFGSIGKDFPFCPFQHFWLRALQEGLKTDLWDYSLNFQAARQGRFGFVRQQQDMPALAYAYHFDAGLYARYLRAEASGWVSRGSRP